MPWVQAEELAAPGADLRALAGLRLHLVEGPGDPAFEVAYALLAGHFAARGQIEAREDLARASAAPYSHGGIWAVHAVLVAFDAAGSAVATLGRYVAYEPGSGILSALDGSVLCVPARRGRGVGPALDRLSLGAGSRLLAAHGAGSATVALEVGDLEVPPAGAGEAEALARARVWGRAGYWAIPRSIFPLALVGMAGDDGAGGDAAPVPMLAVLRAEVCRGAAPAISRALLRALARHLEAAHAWAGGEGPAAARAALEAALDAASVDPVPLVSVEAALAAAWAWAAARP